MIEAAALQRARLLLSDPLLANLIERLQPAGEETRIVGGAIRNALLGQTPTDIDLATTLPPQAVMTKAKAASWQAVPTGIEHGTVTLIRNGRGIEVTTLREDIATDGRRAIVRFGRDFVADAARRDFTINALSMGVDGAIHDYFGGLADLAAGRVRFIGDPAARLREDYLRALRFLRFTASYSTGAPDPAGLSAVLAHRHGLTTLSAERVRHELFKLLGAPRGGAIVMLAENPHRLISGLLKLALKPERFERLMAVTRQASVPAPKALTRLFALAVGEADDIARLKAALRLSNREEGQLAALLGAYDALTAGDALRVVAYRFPDALREAMLVFTIDRGREPELLLREGEIEALRADPRHFLISGADILAAGRAPGPEIGAILAETETAWLASGLPKSHREQLGLLASVLGRRKPG